jgi:ABC-type multidrug transport system fused ATPase/permease subunit
MHQTDTEDLQLGPASLYRVLWRHAAGFRYQVLGFMAMLILAQLVKLLIPYYTGEAINAMQAPGGPDLYQAGWDMTAIFVVCLVGWVFHGPGRALERFTAIKIRERFADSLYAKAVALPLAWHEQHHSGETIQRVEKAGTALFNFSQHQFIYLQNAVSLLGPIIAIFVLSVPTGLAAVAGYALIAVVLVRFDVVMVRLNRAQNRAERRYSAALVDCLGNISTVLTLRLEKATRRLLGEKLAGVFAPMRSGIVMNETKWCVIDILNNGLRCGLAAIYVWLAWRGGGGVLLGSAVMVYQYAQQAGGVVGNMAGNYQDLVGYQTDVCDADPLMDAAADPSSQADIPGTWRRIGIDALDFTYIGPRGASPALHAIAFAIERGSRTAIVGESGAGKSTLLRVLTGLYLAQNVRFSIDGRPMPGLGHLGAIATLVPQDPEIFAGTVGHNITLGLDYTLDEVRRACALSCFQRVVDGLPLGLATDIAERGLNVSGGQKQRLALARGMLAARGSSLIMLDEPTSSLDPETEALVYDNLLAAFPDAAIISSVHRLHLLSRFDRVILMADGRVVAIGTTAELLAREPRFQALWERYAASAAAERENAGDEVAA